MSYAERYKGKLSGRWVCDAEFKHPDGSVTRYHKAFKDKGAADGAEAYYRATGNPPPHLGAPTHAFEHYAKAFRERNPKWCKTRQSIQRLEHAVSRFGKLDIAAVNLRLLEQYADDLAKRDCAPRTVRRYLDVVAVVLRYALDHHAIPYMPRIPRPVDEGEARNAATEAQERAICGWLTDRGKADSAFLIHVLAETGMRTGELWRLRPEQIEDTGLLLDANQTKTKHARWVPLHPDACRQLRAMVAAKALPSYPQLKYNFECALRGLGETKTLSLYSLRHASITRKLAKGAKPTDVAKLHGNSIKTIMGYYHPERDTLAAVAQLVPSVFGETPQKAEVVPFPTYLKSTG